MDENFREGISEILDILEFMDESYTKKIPKNFMEFLEENKSENYVSKIDHTKPLEESNIKEETKNILATIYLNYWCEEDEKEEYKKTLDENEKKYQQEIEKKYSADNLFKENNKKLENNDHMVEYKESFLKKILNKIKKFFR